MEMVKYFVTRRQKYKIAIRSTGRLTALRRQFFCDVALMLKIQLTVVMQAGVER